MTDDICAGVPAALGHCPPPLYNSPTILLSAYGSIWPLFFAGTCSLERVTVADYQATFSAAPEMRSTSAATAQVSWLWGRLQHISDAIGLRWAAGIAAALKGDFKLHADLMPENVTGTGSKAGKTMERFLGPSEGPSGAWKRAPGDGPVWVGRYADPLGSQRVLARGRLTHDGMVHDEF
jgi:hypothetical protein